MFVPVFTTSRASRNILIIRLSFLALFILLMPIALIYDYYEKNAKLQKEINDKIRCSVINYEGEVDVQNGGKKVKSLKNYSFLDNHLFKTGNQSNVEIEMSFGNSVKMYPNSELTAKPSLYDKDNLSKPNIKEAHIELKNGEITFETDGRREGKGNLIVEVSDLKITALSGLFKVIYDKESDEGKIIVKRGSVITNKKDLKNNNIEVSAFFGLFFEKGEVKGIRQISFIDYDWK